MHSQQKIRYSESSCIKKTPNIRCFLSYFQGIVKSNSVLQIMTILVFPSSSTTRSAILYFILSIIPFCLSPDNPPSVRAVCDIGSLNVIKAPFKLWNRHVEPGFPKVRFYLRIRRSFLVFISCTKRIHDLFDGSPQAHFGFRWLFDRGHFFILVLLKYKQR